MGNIIRLNDKQPAEEWLSMSNGCTDVLLDVLVLAGSALAEKDSEKEQVVWLAQHDQNVVGLGTVGFDITEMPWTKADFASQQVFMLRCIAAAREKLWWEKLEYEPHEELLMPQLDTFESFIRSMTEELVDENERLEWLAEADDDDPQLNGFPVCRKHQVLRSWCGCRFCTVYGHGVSYT